MSESTLLIVFISFSIFLMIGAVILRKISVRDIFSEVDAPSSMRKPPPFSEPIKQSSALGVNQDNKAFKLNRKSINNIAKILGAIGAIILFSPLSESFGGLGMILAFLGYLVVKATAEPKKKQENKRVKD